MVVLDNATRLSIFGCESLARTAAFRTQTLQGNGNVEHQDQKDVEVQRFVCRLCVCYLTFFTILILI